MTIFPSKELEFRLIDDQIKTLDRLSRRTENSESLTSAHTEKSFRGILKKKRIQNHFFCYWKRSFLRNDWKNKF